MNDKQRVSEIYALMNDRGFATEYFHTLDNAKARISEMRDHKGEYHDYWNEVADGCWIEHRVTVSAIIVEPKKAKQ